MESDLRKLSSELIVAMNTSDVRSLNEIFSDDVAIYYPGIRPMIGKRMSVTFLRLLLSNFEYLRFTQTDIVINDNKACVVWENKGCRKNGAIYGNKGITFMKAAENKIVFLSDYFKFEASNP